MSLQRTVSVPFSKKEIEMEQTKVTISHSQSSIGLRAIYPMFEIFYRCS